MQQSLTRRHTAIHILLWIALALSMVDCIVQLAITSTYAKWLNNLYASNVQYPLEDGRTIYAVPEQMDQNVEHLCNDSAGVALVLVGFGGIVALLLRRRNNFSHSLFSKIWYHTWLVLTLLSFLLTLGALIYIFVTMNRHAGQTIDLTLLQGQAMRQRWPYGSWDPKSWFDALLSLDLSSSDDRDAITSHIHLFTGSMFNMIPLLVTGLAVLVFAVLDGIFMRRAARSNSEKINGSTL